MDESQSSNLDLEMGLLESEFLNEEFECELSSKISQMSWTLRVSDGLISFYTAMRGTSQKSRAMHG